MRDTDSRSRVENWMMGFDGLAQTIEPLWAYLNPTCLFKWLKES